MSFLSAILGVFMFLSDAFSSVSIRFNRIVTLASNQGGAIL